MSSRDGALPPTPRYRLPDKPSVDGLEERWEVAWEQRGTYRFDRTRPRAEVYAIDTPPPTASGSLHVGHVFSYTHTDAIARYQRMSGKAVFYPIGWDDNGLPTERRVQAYYGVRCDPSLPYEAGFVPPQSAPTNERDFVAVSRRTFIELCQRLTLEDEKAFEAVFRRLGLSVDWAQTYQTIGDVARAASQRAFLRNLSRGEAYQIEAPTLWDVQYRTAVAQAELEDKERPGAYHRLAFTAPDGADVLIDTTRPELLAACVALVTHPDDERYAHLVGGTVTTPLFRVAVPVMAHRLADPDKGTGIAMVCTFGDLTDVTWWRELNLATRPIIGRDGRILAEPPAGLHAEPARSAYARLAGSTVFTARETVVGMLRESGSLIGDIRPITHPVKFYEKGDRPLEIVTTRQWYLRNGGRDALVRDTMLERGRELVWHPDFMRTRYENWVEGLTGDWLISRQRFFGVPFPVWYPLDDDGEVVYSSPLLAEEDTLPVDPSSDTPPGYTDADRGRPGGFVAEPDVMDTWATSSLTPQIASGWERDPDLFGRVFPMDLRPQGHDIIRTWLFATVVRAHAEHDSLPWSNVAISGWILDPDRKKMGKSKGNAVTPLALLEEHGSDALRYWAASGRPGTDTAFDVQQMKVGRRLAIKVLNASRFILSLGVQEAPAAVQEAIDASLLADLARVVARATAAFEAYDYARALEATETFFWSFCDDYLELVKDRAYGDATDPATASAHATLASALAVLLRLFAPILPFVTEEVWSWWQEGSVHHAPWPTTQEAWAGAASAPGQLADVAGVLTAVRKAKSGAQLSMRAEVERAVVSGPAAALTSVAAALSDLRAAGSISDLVVGPEQDTLEVAVTLGAATT